MDAVVDIGYVFSGCHAMQSRDACCEGVWQKDIQFVMVNSWDICTTWNAHKEGGLMAITFFNSWIWFTCIPLMVNICDKKRHLMLFILSYFHDKLIPIMTPVTFNESLTKKCECLHRNMRESMKLIFYVPTMSQYILNVMVADYCIIFSVNVLQMWLA